MDTKFGHPHNKDFCPDTNWRSVQISVIDRRTVKLILVDVVLVVWKATTFDLHNHTIKNLPRFFFFLFYDKLLVATQSWNIFTSLVFIKKYLHNVVVAQD